MNTLISGHCRCHKFTYIQVYTSPSPTPTCSHYNLLNGLLELEKNKDFLEKKEECRDGTKRTETRGDIMW